VGLQYRQNRPAPASEITVFLRFHIARTLRQQYHPWARAAEPALL